MRAVENVTLLLFMTANAIVPFAALWWGLGPDDQPAQLEHQDRGAMTGGGVPYVLGSPA